MTRERVSRFRKLKDFTFSRTANFPQVNPSDCKTLFDTAAPLAAVVIEMSLGDSLPIARERLYAPHDAKPFETPLQRQIHVISILRSFYPQSA
jgi:hypothetical protein